jgi:hypothetical protein
METLGNTWLTEKVKEELKKYFNQISKDIAEKITNSENEKDNVFNEDYISRSLIEIINSYSNSTFFKTLQDLIFKETGAHFYIKGWVNQPKIEGKVGADLGIILEVNTDRFKVEKAIIVQSKKGKFKNGRLTYPEYIKRGKQQINKMLSITQASCFFFYNPSNILNVDLYKPLIAKYVDKIEKIASSNIDYSKPNESDLIKLAAEKYLGILTCPANRLKSVKKLDSSFEMILPLCNTLSEFMVDDFFSCKIGDIDKSVCLKAGYNRDNNNIATNNSLKIILSRKREEDDDIENLNTESSRPRRRKITIPKKIVNEKLE